MKFKKYASIHLYQVIQYNGLLKKARKQKPKNG